MEVILDRDMDNLGYADEVVNVKDGYARNFLIPRGFAHMATPSARKVLEEKLRQRAHKEEKIREQAEEIAKKLEKAEIKIGTKVGENGKIFGSVNNIMLADALSKAGFEIDRKHITIKNEPIKHVGKYEAEIKLHKEVTHNLEFEVSGEG